MYFFFYFILNLQCKYYTRYFVGFGVDVPKNPNYLKIKENGERYASIEL